MIQNSAVALWLSEAGQPLTTDMSLQAEKRARQKAKDKDHKDGKAPAGGGSSTAAGTADTFDDELAAAMAEAAAISNRWAILRAIDDKKCYDVVFSKHSRKQSNPS